VATDLNKGECIRFNEELAAATVESDNGVTIPPGDTVQLNTRSVRDSLNAAGALDSHLGDVAPAAPYLVLKGCPELDMVNTLRGSCVAI
jgi:hypothetical protein